MAVRAIGGYDKDGSWYKNGTQGSAAKSLRNANTKQSGNNVMEKFVDFCVQRGVQAGEFCQ